eukprot:scaffold4147_cov114-Skeletonema_dohrnii-CCMP3373.AAC.3
MAMLNPTHKIQLANPFMHCPTKTTAIPPQTRPQIQQKRHPPTPPAGAGTNRLSQHLQRTNAH